MKELLWSNADSVILRLANVGLIAAYAAACGWSAFDSKKGIVLVLVTSVLITTPYFLAKVLQGMLAGFIITAGLTIVSVIFPPIGLPLLAIWAFLSMVTRLHGLVRKVPYLLGGSVLYGFLALEPRIIRSNSALAEWSQNWPLSTALAAIVTGTLIMMVLLSVYGKFDCSPATSTIFMLGFGCYFILFLLTFFLGGAEDGDSDASMIEDAEDGDPDTREEKHDTILT